MTILLTRKSLAIILFIAQLFQNTTQSLNKLIHDENQLTTKNYQHEQIHLSYGGKYIFLKFF